jgi:hypothetical protein
MADKLIVALSCLPNTTYDLRDVNGDGLDDLIVSAQTADPNNKSYAGKSYVIFGKTDTGAIDLSKLGITIHITCTGD